MRRKRGVVTEHNEQIMKKFDAYERAGFVEFHEVIDGEPYDDSYLDDWGLGPDELEVERKNIHDRILNEGVYGIVFKARNPHGGQFETVYDCWGFVGSDWKESGYDLDGMMAAIEFVDQYILG